MIVLCQVDYLVGWIVTVMLISQLMGLVIMVYVCMHRTISPSVPCISDVINIASMASHNDHVLYVTRMHNDVWCGWMDAHRIPYDAHLSLKEVHTYVYH